jgi:membrane protein DedA with SNARE-associated domain
MPWRRFVLYNAAGAIGWCSTLALLAAFAGPAGAASVSLAGLVATGGGVVAEALRALAARRRRAATEVALASA